MREIHKDHYPECNKEIMRRADHLGKLCKGCSNRKKNRKKYPKSFEVSKKDRLITKRKTRWAIDSGKITRQPCEVCGEPKTEAHHHDYTNPFVLSWLCRTHHMQIHTQH